MKRALLALTLLTAVAAQAQSRDPFATLKNYAAKVLPRCPGGTLTLEPVNSAGPANFSTYVVTLRSSDQYCGTQKYLLHSAKSQQVVVGSVIPLPNDQRPIQTRVSEEASRLLESHADAPGKAAEAAVRRAGDGVLLEEDDRNAPQTRRQDTRH